jgi:hypothetical protein
VSDEEIRLPMACQCDPIVRALLDDLVGERDATTMLHDLHWNFNYDVEWIGVDMWCGLRVHPIFDDYDEEEIPDKWRGLPKIRIEFDKLEHGLAKLIEHLEAKHGRPQVATVTTPD